MGGTRLLTSTKPKGIKKPQTGELPGIARSSGELCTSLESSGYGGTHATTQPHSSPPCCSLPLPVAGRRMRQQPPPGNHHSRNGHSRNRHPGTTTPGTTACTGACTPYISLTTSAIGLKPGVSFTFSATANYVGDPSVTWSIKEGPAGGIITDGGLYTAPAVEGVYHVIATSKASTSLSANSHRRGHRHRIDCGRQTVYREVVPHGVAATQRAGLHRRRNE